jgi:hypothetical protein
MALCICNWGAGDSKFSNSFMLKPTKPIVQSK